jgi:hypothetical protein
MSPAQRARPARDLEGARYIQLKREGPMPYIGVGTEIPVPSSCTMRIMGRGRLSS